MPVTFVVYLDKRLPGVEPTRREVEIPDGYSEIEIDAYLQLELDQMMELEIDAGWYPKVEV